MVDGNKILTVSYGTFSCTLEGFEDSFSTMKAIAEYFRDLASDDRYFGAEPPTPDAAMLARIAEREVSRHVDARVDGNDVVLRAASPDVALPDVALVETQEPKVQDAPVALETPLKVDAPKAKDRKAIKAAKAKAKHAKVKAEKAKRKKAQETKKSAQREAQKAAKLAALTEAQDVVTSPLDEALAPTNEEEQAVETSINALNTSDVIAHSDIEIDLPKIDVLADEPEEDSVAAKLARIRSVVTPAGDTSEGDAFSEDQHAADFNTDNDRDFDDIISAPSDDTDMASVLAAMAESDNAEAEVVFDTPEPSGVDLDAVGEPDAGNDASILSALAGLNLGKDTQDEAPVVAEKPLARVVKVKRKDFEAALADGGLEEVDETETVDFADSTAQAPTSADIVDSVSDALGETSLSDEDEAELMAELAAVEQEIKRTTPISETVETTSDSVEINLQDDVMDVIDATDVTENQDAPLLLDPVDDADETVDRLLTKTQDEFDQPETGRRRNAIAHLKAAVAATRAERGAHGELTPVEDETDTYRDDLAQVVRPRRATASGKRSARPTPKVPPLTLVAEQRIDLETPTAAPVLQSEPAPVRPRRIAKVKSRISDDDLGSFQEFAETQGANDLPDLLEAAAAYAAYIKGQPSFTRPELMSKVMKLSEDEPHSREDSLRSFGQLLREGKIVKIKKGQFAVSEDTRFRPDTARYAGE